MSAPQVPSSLGEFLEGLETRKGEDLRQFLQGLGFEEHPITKTFHSSKQVYQDFINGQAKK